MPATTASPTGLHSAARQTNTYLSHSFASRRTQAYAAAAFLVCNSDRSSPGSGRVRRLAGPVLALLAFHGAQKNSSRNPKPPVKQPIDIHRIIKIDLHDKRIKFLLHFTDGSPIFAKVAARPVSAYFFASRSASFLAEGVPLLLTESITSVAKNFLTNKSISLSPAAYN